MHLNLTGCKRSSKQWRKYVHASFALVGCRPRRRNTPSADHDAPQPRAGALVGSVAPARLGLDGASSSSISTLDLRGDLRLSPSDADMPKTSSNHLRPSSPQVAGLAAPGGDRRRTSPDANPRSPATAKFAFFAGPVSPTFTPPRRLILTTRLSKRRLISRIRLHHAGRDKDNAKR